MLGLLGDFTPASRIVRAVAFTPSVSQPKTERDAELLGNTQKDAEVKWGLRMAELTLSRPLLPLHHFPCTQRVDLTRFFSAAKCPYRRAYRQIPRLLKKRVQMQRSCAAST
jgi:hypothetical protein